MWKETVRELVLAVLTIALALVGFVLFVLTVGEVDGWVVWVLGLVLLVIAALAARSLFRGEWRQAAALIVLSSVGGAAFLVGLYYALGDALCDSGECPDAPRVLPVLIYGGLALVAVGLAMGVRWVWRSRRERTTL